MGCWNGTCMISNLPIESGEKVKLVILKHIDKLDGSGYCNSGDIMSPIFLPIEGVYDDYGTIEDIVKDWNTDLIINTLKKDFSTINADGKVINNYTLDDLIRGIERGNLETKSEGREFAKSELSFVMIRKDVWDSICNEYVGEFINFNRKETDEGYYLSAKEYCKRKFDAYLKAISALEEDEDEELKFMKAMRLSEFCIFRDDRLLRENAIVYSIFLTTDVNFDKESMFKYYSELTSIKSFLDVTRKSWMIQSGAGSQSSDWKVYKMLNKIVDGICDEKIKKIEEYED